MNRLNAFQSYIITTVRSPLYLIVVFVVSIHAVPFAQSFQPDAQALVQASPNPYTGTGCPQNEQILECINNLFTMPHIPVVMDTSGPEGPPKVNGGPTMGNIQTCFGKKCGHSAQKIAPGSCLLPPTLFVFHNRLCYLFLPYY